MTTIGCLRNAHGSVLIYGNKPSAFDGYDFRICTAGPGQQACTKYNQMISERPSALTVTLNGRIARVEQAGGSVREYSTDPAGMRDGDYERSVPLELNFSTAKDLLPSGFHSEVDGKPAKPTNC